MKNIFDIITLKAARRDNIRMNDIENAIRNALKDGDAHAIEIINPRGKVSYEVVYNNGLHDYVMKRIEEVNALDGYTAEEVSVKVAMYNSKKLVKEYNK